MLNVLGGSETELRRASRRRLNGWCCEGRRRAEDSSEEWRGSGRSERREGRDGGGD